MTEDLVINKLLDRLRNVITHKGNPDLICIQSRISCEAILKIIYKKQFNQVPPSITFEKLKEGLVKAGVIPSHIVSLFDAIQRLGNKTAHIDENLTERTASEALVVESSLGNICNWFFNEYLKIVFSLESIFQQTENGHNSIRSNYEDLIRAALADKTLEMDEYEDILKAREDLNLSDEAALEIERKVCQELLNVCINNISDILSTTDLIAFKKFDDAGRQKPQWVLKCFEDPRVIRNLQLRNYISFYFNNIELDAEVEQDQILSILGCWQGWYFQYSSKTYFDLVFLAKNENDFIGLSIEPINPTWNNKGYEDKHLLAWIEGALIDDILFSYTKKYILERSWSIKYDGVLMEMGQVFEGEWSINDLNGTFSAIRSKSLLPIRIFNTDDLLPVIPSTYLNRLKDLTSSWFVQIVGKETVYGVIHMIELRGGSVFANLITAMADEIYVSYLEGEYQENSKAKLQELSAIKGICNLSVLTFNVDWTSHTFNGILKDDVHKMRVIKGFKI